MIDYGSIEQIIGYEFKDKRLLEQCFTHSSYVNEHKGAKSNERLEFFGDSILGFIVTEFLFKKYPDLDEGKLTQMKQAIVSKKPLSCACCDLGLDKFLLMASRVKNDLNKYNFSENLFEAIIGGMYLDGGLEVCKKFITEKLINNHPCIDCEKVDMKGKFQELVQAKKLGQIVYRFDKKEGPDHDPTFFMSVMLDGVVVAQGIGQSKQKASQNAAEKAYKIITSKR